MIEAILVVLTNPVEGREDDFNDWYTHVHVRDALRFRGSIATQRFVLSSSQVQQFGSGAYGWAYLALYEVFDAERFSREHIENALTTRMQVSNAIDAAELNDYHYYPLQFRDNAPGQVHAGGVVMEQIAVPTHQADRFIAWYNQDYLPSRMDLPGVRKGCLMRFLPRGQLIDRIPLHDFVAVYWVDNASETLPWGEDCALRRTSLVDGESLAITCWDPVTPRITEDEVIHTSAEGLAGEEDARRRMGANLIVDRGDDLKPA